MGLNCFRTGAGVVSEGGGEERGRDEPSVVRGGDGELGTE